MKKLILIFVALLCIFPNIVVAEEGYKITVSDYTRGSSKVAEGDMVTNIDQNKTYRGNVSFIVSFDKACLVATRVGDKYMREYGSEVSDGYLFTIDVQADTEIIIVQKGDVNLDGRIRSNDAAAVTRIVTGIMPSDGLKDLIADVDTNGKIRSNDAARITRVVTGIETLNFDIDEWTEPQY